MPNILHYFGFREIGFHKSPHYVRGKKAVLDMLEYEAAKPTNNQSCEFTGEPRATFLVDFSPNMLRAASTHGDHSVRVTDIQTGKCTHILNGHPRTPWCLAFNPTSNDILASGCLGGEVRIWDLLGGGSEVLVNPCVGAVITSLAFHPSGQVLVFATINCIYFWDWKEPKPFAVTKTNHEYERIRWLRFDPFGKYMYTGIANNTTLHREGARDVINICDSRRDHNRNTQAAFRNRIRYNQLMQRFRSFQQNRRQNEYLELRPQSPVHLESLNLARQYANHVTETMNSSVRDDGEHGHGPNQNRQARPSFLTARREVNSTQCTGRHCGNCTSCNRLNPYTEDGSLDSDRFRLSAGRGWGRYQPSFFTSATNNSNSNNSIGDNMNGNSLPERDQLGDSARTRGQQPCHGDGGRQGSREITSDELPSSTLPPPNPQGTASETEDTETSGFEIIRDDQNDPASGSSARTRTDAARRTARSSATETGQRLEQQLQELRHELFNLTRQNMDTSSAESAFPNTRHGLGPSARRRETHSHRFSFYRPAVRSAGSTLSRSIFSRPGNGSGASTSSSFSASSRSLSSFSTVPDPPVSSGLSSSQLNQALNLVVVSRALVNGPSTSAGIGDSRSFGSSSTETSQQATTWLRDFSRNIRLNSLRVPSTLTDNTSQTFGTMNLPEQLDQSTDMTDLNSDRSNGHPIISDDAGATNILDDDEMRAEESLYGCATASSLASLLMSQPSLTSVSTNDSFCPNAPVARNILRSALSTNAVDSHSSVAQTSSTNSRNTPAFASILRRALTATSVTSCSSLLSSSFSSSSHPQSRSRGQSAFVTVTTSSSTNERPLFHETCQNLNSQETPNILSDVSAENGGQAPTTSTANSTQSTMNTASQAQSSNTDQNNSHVQTPIADIQHRLEDILESVRRGRAQQVREGADSQSLQDMEYRLLSQTSEVLSQTTAYWTEFLERSVREMHQRISDLERRLETNRYLLSSHPFSRRRPGRPHDTLMSRLVQNRVSSHNNRRERQPVDTETDDTSSLNTSGQSLETDTHPARPFEASQDDNPADRSGRVQMRRNQVLLDFLVWRESRDPQSQRSLSFRQSLPSSQAQSTSSSNVESDAPSRSNPLTSSIPELSSLTSPAPLSITIHRNREEQIANDEEMGTERGEDAGDGEGQGSSENDGERSWWGLRQIYLHPDYSTSILDDAINRNHDLQHIMNSTLAGVIDREDQAVASNIAPQTHRIQRWDVSDTIVPDISRASVNVVVDHCKLHNDASCDISKDGTMLATFVPSHRGFPNDNILGVFSLRNETFSQCLYTKSFGPNAISVSISPGNHYVMVGLAARRFLLFSAPANKMVGQVYKLVKQKAGEKSMKHETDLIHPHVRGAQVHISINFGRWLPCIGEGLVYGTNRGDLHFCRPASRRIAECERTNWIPKQTRSSRRGAVRSSIATQTATVSIRRTASTQTQREGAETRWHYIV